MLVDFQKFVNLTNRNFIFKTQFLYVKKLVKKPPAMQETWVPSLGEKIPWRRERLPTPVFWPGEFHGLDRGHKESDTTERLSFHFYILFYSQYSNMSQMEINKNTDIPQTQKIEKDFSMSSLPLFRAFKINFLNEQIRFYLVRIKYYNLSMTWYTSTIAMTTSSLTFYTPRTLKQFNTKLHRALIALNELTTNKQKGGEGVSFLMTFCLTIIISRELQRELAEEAGKQHQ